MSVTIKTGGDAPASVQAHPDQPSTSGIPNPIRYAIVDIETYDGVKSRDRDKFITTSKFLCAAVYDSETNWVYVYSPDTLDRLIAHLESVPVVVTFNGKGYDIPVLEAVIGRKLEIKVHV